MTTTSWCSATFLFGKPSTKCQPLQLSFAGIPSKGLFVHTHTQKSLAFKSQPTLFPVWAFKLKPHSGGKRVECDKKLQVVSNNKELKCHIQFYISQRGRILKSSPAFLLLYYTLEIRSTAEVPVAWKALYQHSIAYSTMPMLLLKFHQVSDKTMVFLGGTSNEAFPKQCAAMCRIPKLKIG